MAFLPSSSSTPLASFTNPGKVRQTLYNVKDYGAVGNAKQVTNGAMTSGSTTLTSATASFVTADVGKSIGVHGAGVAGVDLATTISARISSTQVTLAASASTTVSNTTTLYGHDDTTAINNALSAANTASGGWVYGPQANYLISSPLVISSNTKFELATGAVIYLQLDSLCNMLIDSAHKAGTLTVPSAISNVEVVGGFWHRGTNDGTNNARHSIVLGGSNLNVHDITVDSFAGKYAILVQNVRDFTVRNIYFPNQFSDGVHIQGPASNGLIQNIRGVTHDDFVAITPNDYGNFVWGNEGDVTDIVIDTLKIQNGFTNALKILSATTGATNVLNTKRIQARNISGLMSVNAIGGIYIGDDGSSPNTSNGQLDDILVDGVNLNFNSTYNKPQVYIWGVAGGTSLNIPKIILRNIQVSSNCSSVVGIGANVGTLIVDGVAGTTSTAGMAGIVYFLQNIADCSLSKLFLSNVDIVNAGTQTGDVINASGLTSITLGSAYLSNISFTNFSNFCEIDVATSLYLNNVRGISNASLFNVGSAGALTVALGSTCLFDTVTNTIASGGTITRNTGNVETLTDTATVTPNVMLNMGGKLTTLSQGTTIANPTGIPIPFQQYILRIKSTASQSLSWGTQYRGSTATPLPSSTTGSSKTDYLGFQYNVDDTKWDLIALNQGF